MEGRCEAQIWAEESMCSQVWIEDGVFSPDVNGSKACVAQVWLNDGVCSPGVDGRMVNVAQVYIVQ